MPLATYKHFSARQLNLMLFAANIIGAMIYLRAVSPSWAIPEERAHGVYSVTGELFVWALYLCRSLLGLAY